jgi:hypothetical protein
MKVPSLILAAALSSLLLFPGCATVQDSLYTQESEIVEVLQDDGTWLPATNTIYRPKYSGELARAGSVIQAVDPTPISTFVFPIVGWIYAVGATWLNRVNKRKAKTKEMTLAKAIVHHGNEGIMLLDDIISDPKLKDEKRAKLLARLQEIQQRAGVWNDIKPFLDPVSEMEYLARQKFGK